MKIESESDIILNHIKGNWRYKVFKYKDKTYILDGSTYWFSFLLNMTKWIFLPIRAYEVNDMVMKYLKEEVSVGGINLSWHILFIIMSISAIIAKVIQRIVNGLNLTKNINIIYIFLIPTIFIGYFTISRYLKKRKIFRILNRQYSEKRIRFRLPFEKVVRDILPLLLLLVGLLVVGTISDINNIIAKDPDVRTYLTYFLAFFIWFTLVMCTTIGVKHLVGAVVTIEDK